MELYDEDKEFPVETVPQTFIYTVTTVVVILAIAVGAVVSHFFG